MMSLVLLSTIVSIVVQKLRINLSFKKKGSVRIDKSYI